MSIENILDKNVDLTSQKLKLKEETADNNVSDIKNEVKNDEKSDKLVSDPAVSDSNFRIKKEQPSIPVPNDKKIDALIMRPESLKAQDDAIREQEAFFDVAENTNHYIKERRKVDKYPNLTMFGKPRFKKD